MRARDIDYWEDVDKKSRGKLLECIENDLNNICSN